MLLVFINQCTLLVKKKSDLIETFSKIFINNKLSNCGAPISFAHPSEIFRCQSEISLLELHANSLRSIERETAVLCDVTTWFNHSDPIVIIVKVKYCIYNYSSCRNIDFAKVLVSCYMCSVCALLCNLIYFQHIQPLQGTCYGGGLDLTWRTPDLQQQIIFKHNASVTSYIKKSYLKCKVCRSLLWLAGSSIGSVVQLL